VAPAIDQPPAVPAIAAAEASASTRRRESRKSPPSGTIRVGSLSVIVILPHSAVARLIL